ncbi:transcriptional regulator, partial [Kouleothrix aurantiaca]
QELPERLEQAITSKQVVAVAALAGWGKTTALAQWARQTVLPVAWYTLDSTDRDPCQFLDYVMASAEPYVPGVAEILQRLDGTSPQSLPELFRQAALLVAAAPRPFALVLDDFHVLEDENLPVLPGSELIFEFVAKIAEYATSCHLVLASRMLPNIQGLARLIAQRRAVFFDYAVLQWSADDIQQLALSNSGVQLNPAGAEQLALQMNGWVTGIILSLDQDVSTPQPVFDLAADAGHVYAFFAEQIIAPLPPDLLRFLEDTSVLEDLSPQRCNALRNTHDSGAFLAEITRRGLFISQKGSWLTYHSLFRDFLRARLAHNPVRERELLLRAAELYRNDDDLDRALECYLAARADEAAIA